MGCDDSLIIRSRMMFSYERFRFVIGFNNIIMKQRSCIDSRSTFLLVAFLVLRSVETTLSNSFYHKIGRVDE